MHDIHSKYQRGRQLLFQSAQTIETESLRMEWEMEDRKRKDIVLFLFIVLHIQLILKTSIVTLGNTMCQWPQLKGLLNSFSELSSASHGLHPLSFINDGKQVSVSSFSNVSFLSAFPLLSSLFPFLPSPLPSSSLLPSSCPFLSSPPPVLSSSSSS